MSDATLIYPHQLFHTSPALARTRPVYLVEEPLLLTHNPIHIQKLIWHKLSLDAYETHLTAQGYLVHRLPLTTGTTTTTLLDTIAQAGVTTIHVCDTTDDYLEQALAAHSLTRIHYESPLFLLGKDEACERYVTAKRFMATFYKKLRQDKRLLLDSTGRPQGGAWSFDSENRRTLPRTLPLPSDFTPDDPTALTDATAWARRLAATTYGEPGLYFPYTHAAAQRWLQDFLRDRLPLFGTYEDAIHEHHTRLFHSGLSPLLNSGLLTPEAVIEATLTYAAQAAIPLASLEGFLRQIIGWREFIRAAYEVDGRTMRRKNFWQHTASLPSTAWTGHTGLLPVDTAIARTLRYAYTHHIERLMVMGNFFLLTRVHPDEVYRWFMGMYIDAYDWVMVPNVYGMSQFADGGLFATKPYLSGGHYLKKMSRFSHTQWADTFTALYWRFIADHMAFFRSNHRLAMMPRLYDKLPATKKQQYATLSTTFLTTFFNSPPP